MLFEFSDEHGELRRTVRDFLEKDSDEKRVRSLMESEQGYDPTSWSRMAEELGIVGLIASERHGGAGFGMIESKLLCTALRPRPLGQGGYSRRPCRSISFATVKRPATPNAAFKHQMFP